MKKRAHARKNLPMLKRLARHPRQYRALKFLVKFNVFAIPLYIILLLDIQIVFLQKITADITYALLGATGVPASISGLMISIPVDYGSWAALITWDCVGWKSMLAFAALVFATERPLRSKAKAMALVPLIYVINLARVWFMFYYVYTQGLSGFAFIHATIWSFGLISAVLVIWALWMEKDRIIPAFTNGFLYRAKQ